MAAAQTCGKLSQQQTSTTVHPSHALYLAQGFLGSKWPSQVNGMAVTVPSRSDLDALMVDLKGGATMLPPCFAFLLSAHFEVDILYLDFEATHLLGTLYSGEYSSVLCLLQMHPSSRLQLKCPPSAPATSEPQVQCRRHQSQHTLLAAPLPHCRVFRGWL